jgi:hypothetical protein
MTCGTYIRIVNDSVVDGKFAVGKIGKNSGKFPEIFGNFPIDLVFFHFLENFRKFSGNIVEFIFR